MLSSSIRYKSPNHCTGLTGLAMSLMLFTRRCCCEDDEDIPAAPAPIDDDGTGALTRCEGKAEGGAVVGGGGGMKKDPMGA